MRILIIEDDTDVRESIAQSLMAADFRVDVVDNGPEGLYRAQEWTYDVVVLDIMLPEMDGWTVLQKLRSEGITTPILMLSALGETEHKVRGLEDGADDYLAKPYHTHELVARIRALARRTPNVSNDIITIGRVTIHIRDRYVELDSEPVELTASQFRILAYLSRRVGRIVTRPDLLDAVYGDDEEKNSNVIEVQIYHIRRKLGKDFLQSRRGLGYVIPKP